LLSTIFSKNFINPKPHFNMKNEVSRREFLTFTSLATLGFSLSIGEAFAGNTNSFWSVKPNSKFAGVQIGVITYSFRSMPHDIDQLLQFCIDCNVSAIEMMGDPAEEFAGKPKSPFRMGPPMGATAGGRPQGGRPEGGRPEGGRPQGGRPEGGRPEGGRPQGDRQNDVQRAPAPGGGAPGGMGQRPPMTDEQRAQMAAYNKSVAEWRLTAPMDKFKQIGKKFKKAGIYIYAFKPNAFGANNTDAEIEYGMQAAKALGAKSVTLELPTDPAQTQRLGDLGAKNGVYVGYHAHLQATDTLWDVALAQSPFNSMNLDCGHYIAVGGKNTKASLLALIEAKHDRITSMHIKDRTADGKGNLAWGSGDTPLKEILNLMKEKQYKFPASIELEYDIPAGSDALIEVKKCVLYARSILI
jgi:sugar phosphate isomerase/epimerase